MRKLNDTSKICTFLCIVLCVGSLSGCGAAMQFLADGTDAVLNGLADGTNIVMNGLADGTEQILSDLSEADDGQAKDSILKAFGELVGDAGTAALTPQSKLQGHKENGADDYTGASREPMKQHIPSLTGTEILFGGTTLERGAGSTIHITVHFLSKAAKQQFFFAQGQMIQSFFSRKAVSTMAR